MLIGEGSKGVEVFHASMQYLDDSCDPPRVVTGTFPYSAKGGPTRSELLTMLGVPTSGEFARPVVTAPPTLLEYPCGLTVDLKAQGVTLSGEAVAVTPTEFGILSAITRAAPTAADRRVVRRDEIMAEVWGSRGTEDPHVVDVHMHNLRASLGEGGETPAGERIVATVRGAGFIIGTAVFGPEMLPPSQRRVER